MEYLKEHQIEHFLRIMKILETSPFALDHSVMGAGKTYVGTAIAAAYNLRLVVCGPRGCLSTWEKAAKLMKVDIIFSSTYEMLRSKQGHTPGHGYLMRYDYKEGTSFAVTESLKELIESGVLIVADEFQKLKNNSDQTKAFGTFVSPLIKEGGLSRLLLLSASPFDKEEHAKNFFRMIGYIEQTRLYTIDRDKQFIPLGIEDLITNLSLDAPDETEELIEKFAPLNKNNIKEFIFTAFTDIMVPYFSSSMPSPTIDKIKDVGNGYYKMNEKEEERLLECIQHLQTVTSFNNETGMIGRDKLVMGQITKSLMGIEVAKIPIFTRLAKEQLDADPHCRVVLFVNYTETVETLSKNLAEHSPLIYNGSIKTKAKEDEIIASFQEGKSRLLIANMKKGGVTISLHDLKGGEKRYSFLSPNYSILDMHQASGRTYRQGLMSDAVIRVVYGLITKEDTRVLESKILKSLSKKTEDMKRILTLQVEEGILFPGEYPDILEV